MKNGIIAFCGSKGSGKSTSATIFKDLYTGPTEELAFAGHLKNVCAQVFGIEMKYFIDPSLKEVELPNYVTIQKEHVEQIFKLFDITGYQFDKHVRPHVGQVFDKPRSVLQYVGTEVLHPMDPLIHVKVTLKQKDPTKLTIITDLRFLQEFNYLKDNPDFLPVYVFNTRAELAAANDTHPSERQLLLFKDKCLKMDNNSDISKLTRKIKDIIAVNYGRGT